MQGADADACKRAFRAKVLLHHPDRQNNDQSGSPSQGASHDEFVAVVHAYEVEPYRLTVESPTHMRRVPSEPSK